VRGRVTPPTTAAVPPTTTPATTATTATTTAPATTTPEPTATAEPPRTESGGGQRTGSVGEQRAMLPSAARCNDPVAGVWRAHKYHPGSHDWVIFTLRINRLPDNRLQGAIVSRLWSGLSMDSRPPGRCGGLLTDFDYLVRMPAQGSFTEGNRVSFSSMTYQVERAFCSSAYFAYNPDAFSGVIDPGRQEFQSVNNDGGRDQNAPYVFRRVGCLPGDAVQAGAGGDAGTP
jgi:hypothetical protein